MANTILITANWHTGALSQQTISRQYDNNRYVVQFVGYPEASEGNELDYYLLVWMSSAPGERPDEIAPIQLASDQWYISNVFTQQTQQIKFQMCALNTAGTFEAHSPIFTGFVRNSLEHDGTAQDIDVSTLFDAYREYLNELIIRAGAVVIDSTLSQSGQAADAKATGQEKAKTFVTLGAAGITFTGNTSSSDPLVASVPLYYYRNLGTSGNAFTNKTGSTYTIENNQVLVYDVNTHALSVKAASAVLAVADVVLLWKQTTTIKGEWAFYYYDFINTDFEIDLGAGGISFSGNSEQNDPLSITVPLVYYRNTGSSGAGFLNKTGGTYSLENNQALVFDITSKTLSVISVVSLFSTNYVTLIWKHVTAIKGLWAHYYYESFAVDYEVVPASNARFSGNTSTSDPLIITTPYIYYRRYATSGTGYVNVTGGTYSLTNNQALVFDMESKTVEVLSVSTVFPRNKKMLLWKQETAIKGPWAVYFYANRSKLYLKRVMSRQGEGYDYPDNSMEAVKSALSDGYPAIRISVALTSDNIWYCTHCYEIENNATSNCLSVNGETYTSNVFINNSMSQFMDTLSYKGYAIPKLTDVLAFASRYDVEVTLELKDDITTQGAQTLLNLLDYYRLKKVVLSGSTTQLQVFTVINTNLDIGVIFHYSAANAQSVITTFSGNYKSLRFDCWYTDTITQSDVTDVIHPDYTIKLGGGAIRRDDLLTYVQWADVCEYAGVYSAL